MINPDIAPSESGVEVCNEPSEKVKLDDEAQVFDVSNTGDVFDGLCTGFDIVAW